jgi:hypothetical protein
MFSRFLLHDPSAMGIRGVSGKGKLSCWGRVIKRHRRCQVVLCILESLLCGGGPHQCFGPSLQEICQRAQNLCAVEQKGGKNLPCRENVAKLFDVLRGWAKFNFGGMIDHGGHSCCRNRVAKNSQRRGCKNAFFKINCEAIGG